MKRIEHSTQIPRFKPLLDLPMRSVSTPLGTALAVFFILLFLVQPLHAAVDNDPLEKVNRVTYQFNKQLDRFIVKPLAVTYDRFTPASAKTGVHNFFSNLDDVRVTFNDLMQLKFARAATDFGRFAVNSTIGLGGLIEVADPAFDWQKNQQDFGKTLAMWGVEPGPYVVLPLFGSRTMRGVFAMGVDSFADPLVDVNHVQSRNSLMAVKTTDYRVGVVSFDELVVGDEYSFMRDIYFQLREYSLSEAYVEVAFEEF
ncbi:MAG: hypothetical protein COA96_17740 [SAR86 cluster bacterium]|uniref:ABC transporter n=1 Tax=SAR86 cluster bacterium TaxID=2030880 RepID=A0A2A5ADN6_9GAMM|nr:MAG: hypothetical protein COA96_17740 [SAR86 cluster bacterium]